MSRHFGRWIDDRREAVGLSLFRCAANLGSHPNTLTRWILNPAAPGLTPERVASFERVLEVKPVEVLDRAGLLPPDLRAVAIDAGMLTDASEAEGSDG